jgi:hypothetical protein
MSADNGIYILKTPKGAGFEYRVRELQAVENVNWDSLKFKDVGLTGDYTDDDSVRIVNARDMWEGAPVFATRDEALVEACRLEERIAKSDFPILEYGVGFVHINREF